MRKLLRWIGIIGGTAVVGLVVGIGFPYLIEKTVGIGSANNQNSFAGAKSKLDNECEAESKQYNPLIMQANCGNLTASDCCRIKNWWNNKLQDDKLVGRGTYSFGLYDSVGKVDNHGNDIILREFKNYCLEANWTAEDCKAKISSLFTLFKLNREQENQKAEAQKQAEEQAEKDRQKQLGY